MLSESDLLYFISPILKSEKIKMHKTYQELICVCLYLWQQSIYIREVVKDLVINKNIY